MQGNKQDARIKELVIAELGWDSHVSETDIGVQVKNGVVTLTGTVDAWGKRAAAAKAAHRVVGVRDVADEIKVHLPDSSERSDTDIAAAVRSALEWDVFVPEERIRTTVSDGLVTLEGTVDRYAQKADAERAIRNIVGVRDVRNQIVIDAKVDAARVKQAIEDALERHVSREAQNITTVVEGGEVTLTGKVDSWAERRVALGAAYGTPGVSRVLDRLEVGAR